MAVYEFGVEPDLLLVDGGVERLGATDASLQIRDYRASSTHETHRALGDAPAIPALVAGLAACGIEIDGVGHRLVYGGSTHEEPARITPSLVRSLVALEPFDPLHLPAALEAIAQIETALPAVPQVACFDTAFHRRMPAVAHRLPLPRELFSEGVRRYGFHGLSYESIVREVGERGARGKMLVAHLGNGASLAAMQDGKPIDTTMGFSPLGGLMMGTRPGDLDPGAMLYLLREKKYTLEEITDALTQRSGLLGVSDCSADMQILLERRANDVAAAQAVELFVYLATKQIGALVAALGGLDTMVFTGGIGERAAPIRSEIAARLAYLGVELDPARNAVGAPVISSGGARVVVRVIATKETLMVARHTCETLFGASSLGA
jgi:acetate kinase